MVCVKCEHLDGAAPDCPWCEGKGIDYVEQPEKVITLHAGLALRAFFVYRAHGTLPCSGGSLDQTACWWSVVEVFAPIVVEWERSEMKARS